MNGQAKFMTYGEGGLATAFIALAFVSVIIAAKAYTPAYAFHAYLPLQAGARLSLSHRRPKPHRPVSVMIHHRVFYFIIWTLVIWGASYVNQNVH